MTIYHLEVHLVIKASWGVFSILFTERLAVIRASHIHGQLAVIQMIVQLELALLTVNLLIDQALKLGVGRIPPR